MFQSYQFMQINPDIIIIILFTLYFLLVSIVSIHADQSRHVQQQQAPVANQQVSIVSIHADQSRL